MNILFVANTASSLAGGVETWILRTVIHLGVIGHAVTIIYPSKDGGDENYINEISKKAKIIFIESSHPIFLNYRKDLQLENYDVVFCVGLRALMISLVIMDEYRLNSKLVMGVFHPREYCWHSKYTRYPKLLGWTVLNCIPLENIFFMNHATAQAHTECSGRDFASCPIIQLPIDIQRFRSMQRNKIIRKKIVSIGTINNFKPYPFSVIDTIFELSGKGYSFEYHIYGEGPLKEELLTYIKTKKLQNRVFIHGWLSYDRFSEPLADAFVFIGMGTALLEAAACGVPSMIAIESNIKPTTYGYVHHRTSFNIGEVERDDPGYSIGDQLEWLYKLDADAYQMECIKSKYWVENNFSINNVMKKFVEALKATKDFNFPVTATMKIFDFVDIWSWRLLRRIGFTDPVSQKNPKPPILPC